MRRWISWICLSAVVAWLLVAPRRVSACSCVATPIYRSDPGDSERDVALNQAIMVEGVFHASSVRLEDEGGNPVAFELNAGPWPGCEGTSADLLPKAPLAPNTRYTIRVEPMYPASTHAGETSSFSFTTGTTLRPEPTLAPPRGSASVVFDGPVAMCGAGITVYTCLDVDAPEDIELILRRGQEVLMRTTTLVQDDGLYGLTRMPDCVELRRRAPTGKRSAPLLICGDALRARAWTKSDSQRDVIQCSDGVIGAPAPITRDPDASPAPTPDASLAGSGASDMPPHAQAGSGRSEAGSRSEASDSQPSAAEPAANHDTHRTYGCAASRRDTSGAGVLAMWMILLFARRRSRV